MTIPVYRQNLAYDDWEVASVYDSDDCDSLGGSASYESSHCSSVLDDAAFQSDDLPYEDTRPRVDYAVPQSQNYVPMTVTRSQWQTTHVSGKRSNFVLPPVPIVPPPGVIFPPKDWVHPPQDMYRSPSSMGMDMAPPPSSLLFSPSTPPPRAPSPLIGRPSPAKTIAHSQVNSHASPIIPPPPHYHELVHAMSPRLTEGGCQAHSMAMSPRRSGHDRPLSYCPEVAMTRRPQTGGEPMTVAEERHCGGAGEAVVGIRRERRPSIWQRFVRRFSPSRGHT